jgi:hypothetical protein
MMIFNMSISYFSQIFTLYSSIVWGRKSFFLGEGECFFSFWNFSYLVFLGVILGEKAHHHRQQHTHLVLLSCMLVLVGEEEEEEEEEFPIVTLPTQRVRCWKTRTTSELPFPSHLIMSFPRLQQHKHT